MKSNPPRLSWGGGGGLKQCKLTAFRYGKELIKENKHSNCKSVQNCWLLFLFCLVGVSRRNFICFKFNSAQQSADYSSRGENSKRLKCYLQNTQLFFKFHGPLWLTGKFGIKEHGRAGFWKNVRQKKSKSLTVLNSKIVLRMTYFK